MTAALGDLAIGWIADITHLVARRLALEWHIEDDLLEFPPTQRQARHRVCIV